MRVNNKPFSQFHHPVFLAPFHADLVEAAGERLLAASCKCISFTFNSLLTAASLKHTIHQEEKIKSFPNMYLNGKILCSTTMKEPVKLILACFPNLTGAITLNMAIFDV